MPLWCNCSADTDSKLSRIQSQNERILRELRALRSLVFSQLLPDCFQVTIVGEEKDRMIYKVNFPAVPEGADVASQDFEVTLDGSSLGVSNLAPDVTSRQIKVPKNSSVSLSLRYADADGNVGEPRTQDFVAVDTIPPDAPGEFGAIELLTDDENAEPEN